MSTSLQVKHVLRTGLRGRWWRQGGSWGGTGKPGDSREPGQRTPTLVALVVFTPCHRVVTPRPYSLLRSPRLDLCLGLAGAGGRKRSFSEVYGGQLRNKGQAWEPERRCLPPSSCGDGRANWQPHFRPKRCRSEVRPRRGLSAVKQRRSPKKVLGVGRGLWGWEGRL